MKSCVSGKSAEKWLTCWSGEVGRAGLAARVSRWIAFVRLELRWVTPGRLVSKLAVSRCVRVTLCGARRTASLLDVDVVAVSTYPAGKIHRPDGGLPSAFSSGRSRQPLSGRHRFCPSARQRPASGKWSARSSGPTEGRLYIFDYLKFTVYYIIIIIDIFMYYLYTMYA